MIALSAEDAAAQAHVQPDGRGLVDDHESVPVGVVQHGLGVRVVRGAQRVGADPLQQPEVVQHVRVVVTLPQHADVLVLAEAGEVERLAVDQEPGAVDGDGAHADTLGVAVDQLAVASQLELQVVEVALPWLPALDVGHGQRAHGSRTGGHLVPIGIGQHDRDLAAVGLPGDHDVVVHQPGQPVQISPYGDVVEVDGVGGVQPDRAVQTGVVEEVVPVALPLPVRGVLDHARRDGLEAQGVVDLDAEADLGTRSDVVGDVDLERQVPALVGDDLDVVDPDRRAVGGGLQMQHDATVTPAGRHPHRPLVPDRTDVVADARVRADVVVAGRDRHLARLGKRPGEPAICPADAGRVEDEGPESVQVLGLAGGVVLGAQHRCLL